ncbi:C4-dicarboxylate transporter/malic acid transporter [Drepanopeziza brunnea f. sp. 'multigermtubi' MB_m1]|uniref:C4-dicarboxylate transporter/malic acid transporter n=1 Tax=Marssonina brunnea f. sp. multigermtubi (strain MB_m1) TaxID=1072389 RepID=K1WJ69_MARBU|nr:C4-dicarboxylate transporter/malic acid transporter [Drepanopeziza brunnea f. sp. 'multigermtubi' MB_m1]EKD12926.1 C4-dicarboxylate transporter/malic acid transporter [Drepanopeziza brunnea f. sp. 'multigermtubi' MB_m1]
MSTQAGPIDELVNYKKAILRDERRDTRIRNDIESTLEFLSQRKSAFISPNDNRSAGPFTPPAHTRSNTGLSNAMTYPQISRPMEYFPANAYSNHNDMEKGSVDVKQGAHAPPAAHAPAAHHDDHHHISAGPHTFKERLKHFTFAWYAFTMATGGVATILSVVPNRFPGLTGLGIFLFIFNLICFTLITILMITRFAIYPERLKPAFTNPHEGFFSATFWLSIATIMNNAVAYGIPNTGPWLVEGLRIGFWIYTIAVTFHAIIYYHVLFSVKKLVLTNVLPGWVLPIFPAMLVGTIASTITKTQPQEHAIPILVTGLTYQGLGFMVALMMYPLYFGRLLTSGLPIYLSRPAMFIAVGPPAFTGLAFIGMAQDIQILKLFDGYTTLPGITNQSLVPDMIALAALMIAIFLWLFAFWAFAIAVIAMVDGLPHNDFHLNWYAKVFPNVGFTIATIKIGERLGSNSIQLVGTGMATVFFFAWLLIFIYHIRAYVQHMICWPGRDEDAH